MAMGDVVSLNKHRKSRERLARERLADENRTKFGRTKAEKIVTQLETERVKRQLDHKQIEADMTPSPGPEPAKPSK
jgi:hypothetical protein